MHASGRITVWSCTQTPFAVRAELARILGVTVNQIRVIAPYIGGGYGAKTNVKIEHLPVLLARKAGRPVKLTLTHNEIFFTVTKHAARIRLRTAATRAGDLLGQAVEIYWDTGAYWAYESQLDTLARELGVDPVELRRRNLYREGELFITGEPLHSLGVRESLDQVARSLRWEEWRAARRAPEGPWVYGKGVACTLKNTVTPSGSSAAVKLNEDGTVEVLCATVEIGQGARTVLSQIVAQEVGLPISGVTFAEVDTDVVPFDRGTISARSTFHMGRALQAAVADLKAQLVAGAADLLEASPADLVVEGGRVYVQGTPERGLSFVQINRRQFGKGGGTFFGHGAFKSPGRGVTDGREHEINSVFWFGGAAGAEVAVNTRTGEIRVLHLVNATDAGKALNPLQVEAQIRGCAILGYGGAMFEEVAFEGGQPVNASLLAYRIPCAADLPARMEAIIVETPHRDGPYGSKGVGETAVAPVAPAIGNALADALGIRLRDLPLTPDKVLLALRERQAAQVPPAR
ncbi:MAG: molybdopterin-dependent oxidoreductase [Deltaproteobacteria bacterium]|nr:molybdopterin-dependent oxidoreductase [Deltaproteobacteria bacterium]